jgi:hypothetical protein
MIVSSHGVPFLILRAVAVDSNPCANRVGYCATPSPRQALRDIVRRPLHARHLITLCAICGMVQYATVQVQRQALAYTLCNMCNGAICNGAGATPRACLHAVQHAQYVRRSSSGGPSSMAPACSPRASLRPGSGPTWTSSTGTWTMRASRRSAASPPMCGWSTATSWSTLGVPTAPFRTYGMSEV